MKNTKRVLPVLVVSFLAFTNNVAEAELDKEDRIRLAKQMLREASRMVPNIPDDLSNGIQGDKGILLRNIGRVQSQIRDREGLWDTAARVIPLGKEQGYLAVPLIQIADAQLKAGFLEDGVVTAKTALEIVLSHKTDRMFDSRLYFIWITFMDAGEIGRAVEIAKMHSNEADIAYALEIIGSHQAQAGQMEQAQKLKKESQSIADTIDDPGEKTRFLIDKARHLVKMNDFETVAESLFQAKIAVRAIPKPEERASLLLEIAVHEKEIGEDRMFQESLKEVVQVIVAMVPEARIRVDRYLSVASTLQEESRKEEALPIVRKAFDEAQLEPDLYQKTFSLIRVAKTELELGESKRAEEVIQLAIRTIEEDAFPDNKIAALVTFRFYRGIWDKLGSEELARIEHIVDTLPSDVEKNKPYALSFLTDLKARNELGSQALEITDRIQKEPMVKGHSIFRIARMKIETEKINVTISWAKELTSPLDKVNAYFGIAVGLLDHMEGE